MKATLRCLAVLAAIVASPYPSELLAQAPTRWIGPANSSAWLTTGNWSTGFYPDPGFDSDARIGTDTTIPSVPNSITINISTDLTSNPSPAIFLGDAAGYEGTLNITSGGKLVTALGVVATSANFDVGLGGGKGTLNVSGTGMLDVGERLVASTSGAAGSAISLSDSATVTAASAFFDRNLLISGPNVSFSVTGDAILGLAGTHAWDFAASGPGAGPSRLSVGGQLDLGGTLKLDTRGATLNVGDSFVIADSASVVNGFSNVDLSAVPGLGLGVSVRAISAPGGTNGVLTSAVVEQQPVLRVNRRTGAVSIENPGSAASLPMDVYVVGSGQGSLNTANWTGSLAPADGWQRANPQSTALSELNPLGAQSIAASTTVAMGNVFQPAAAPFGQDTDDVSFRFAPEGQGFVDGIVIYEGIPTDTLTLNVDRITGEAQILNGYNGSVSIDTYVVTSESNSLATSPGGWNSLGGDWQIGVNNTGTLSELNPLGELVLAKNQAANLGNLFDFDAVGAMEDLVFRFALPTENFFRTGKVVFADALTTLPQGLPGDFNADGAVDAADYTVWRDNLGGDDSALNGNGVGSGTVVTADYALWRSNYGATGAPPAPAASVAAPEPGSLGLIALGLLLATGRRRRSSQERV